MSPWHCIAESDMREFMHTQQHDRQNKQNRTGAQKVRQQRGKSPIMAKNLILVAKIAAKQLVTRGRCAHRSRIFHSPLSS